MKQLAYILFPFLICCFLLPSIRPAYGGQDAFTKWSSFAQTNDARKLLSWMNCSMKEFVSDVQCPKTLDMPTPPFYGQLGIFVTLVRKGKVRGCFGAFDHRSDKIDGVLKDYLLGALKRDNRYQPLDAFEIDDTRIIITIAGTQYTIDDIDSIDIANYGVAATFDNNERDVLVPAEIKNIDSLRKRWRGKEVNQLTIFKTITIK